MNITWTLRWIAIMLYIRLFSRIFWFSIRLFFQSWIFIISNMSLDRLLWNRIIRNKISQYQIDFDWLSFFSQIQYDHNRLKLFYASIVKNINVRFNSNISTFINSHEISLSSFFCQLNLHRTISTILLFLFNHSRLSQTRHVKKSWKFVDHCFIQTSFDSNHYCWKLWCFKSFSFQRCFLTKTIKVEVKSICVNNRASFFTKHQFLTFKIWKKICFRCREFNWVNSTDSNRWNFDLTNDNVFHNVIFIDCVVEIELLLFFNA